MTLDYQTLESLRQNHPAWRLLASPHAPLIASFLQAAYITPNVRVLAQADLMEALEDELFAIREFAGPESFPKSAMDYLNDWAAPEKGWLRKFYRQDSDEVQFDLTPATEKAIAWLESLSERSFVGTESRLLTLFDLLKQLQKGSTDDPELRLQELQARRDEIDREIAQVKDGNIALLDDTALRDRFMQFTQQAKELLSDFREVEHNFRGLDRSVRERIAQWQGDKGELLEDIMGERDAIAGSDQGNSFRAFWDFLMSPARQEEFTELLDQVLKLSAIAELKPDPRTRRIHYDWLEAGEHTQRTVARLSQQLRRFLDDQAWLENKRIMNILQGIENKTLEFREPLFSSSASNTSNEFMMMDAASANVEIPMERPLYTPPLKTQIANIKLESGDEALDFSALFSQVVINKPAIARHIRQSLQL
ncbi:MAG: DUF3375 domain-containing protein, partial [Gammaproteobacteria bacterium]|nr:DUF3375 domain-containing protein [Gammaproteobacteria bacterium]